MKSYKETVKEITANTTVPIEDIFDYEHTPLSDICESYFEFYSEALRRNKDFGIEPCVLLFNNYRGRNASASKNNGYYIIQFNIGLIGHLVWLFKNNEELLVGTDNDEYIEFEKSLDVPVNELMYQFAIHFTFYHELAHLVQNSIELENLICELLNSKCNYSQHNHMLELDADKFSTISTGTHVVQFINRVFGSSLTNEIIEKTLILICSSALFYILSFSSNKHDIYYKEYSHPHPAIRITHIISHLISYVKQSLTEKGFEIDIKNREVINKCILFSNNIAIRKLNNRTIEDYVHIISNELEDIATYIKGFETLMTQDDTLAMSKWNKRAQDLSMK